MFITNCLYTPTSADLLALGAFDIISPDILSLLNDSTRGEERGEDWSKDRQLSVQIVVLNLHLQNAHNEMKTRMEQGLLDFDELLDKYKIDCIRKTLACKGYDIDPLLIHYGLFKGLDGIGYMNIETGYNIWQINKIRNNV